MTFKEWFVKASIGDVAQAPSGYWFAKQNEVFMFLIGTNFEYTHYMPAFERFIEDYKYTYVVEYIISSEMSFPSEKGNISHTEHRIASILFDKELIVLCTCAREVWLSVGCKCGAIVPYSERNKNE